ncbi:MAG: L-2-amino-thiazoline-4-carboxylic acid hydrolase [Synergistaceae bacterium]|nr:L-2-amino-thiazoline-4-carboxylic acid hydrolase [Synergistaceae bacterium]
MTFTEKTHAFIAAKYYVRLTEAFGDVGVGIFIHATQYYAGQRGRRMAQRALRDGKELTYETYMEYGEWVNTPEIIAAESANQSVVEAISPDFVIRISRCPWHLQFKEMGLTEAGHEYCKHLDSAICRGFNPYLTYTVEKTLHKSDCCIHRISDTNYASKPNVTKKKEYLHSFEYHCAHSYWAYNEVTAAVRGQRGEEVNAKVLADFAAEYGQEAADVLAGYRYVNFNVC